MLHGSRILTLWAGCVFAGLASALQAQDTFSIVAVDSATRTIVSAGASCIDADQIPRGARAISDVVPGRGALHTQSLYVPANQRLGRSLLVSGLPAKRLVDTLIARDAARAPSYRQYVAATIGPDGAVEVAAFTGGDCFGWAGHWTGTHLAVAGNILVGEEVVARMRGAFAAARGRGRPVAEAVAASLGAVAFPGADRRCLSQGLSSRSAFLRVVDASGTDATRSVDLVVERPRGGADPIASLLAEFEAWRSSTAAGVDRERGE